MKERNPYLRRISSQEPRHHSYDISTNKHSIIQADGTHIPIHKTGAHPAAFRTAFSGFVTHKQRYEGAKEHPSSLHFIPDLTYYPKKSFLTPTPNKFAGYAQFPYKIKPDLPLHLHVRAQHKFVSKSMISKPETILEAASKRGLQNSFLETSFENMTETKVLPRNRKKSCYNNRCRELKHFMQDYKARLSRQEMEKGFTQGRSFYEGALAQQKQESMLLSTMVSG